MTRIAVVDQVGNPGGGSRFLRALLLGYRRVRPDVSITLLCNGAALEREGVLDEFTRAGITVVQLESVRPRSRSLPARAARVPGRLLSAFEWLPAAWSRTLDRELRLRLRGFDVAHFWWPRGVAPPETSVPLAATFHDFNEKYAFQTPTFTRADATALDRLTDAWIGRCTPIVSSQFMHDEFLRHYPHAPRRPEVLRLQLNPPTSRAGSSHERLAALGVRRPYVLYPANISAHKNVAAAISAQSRLAAQGVDLSLVITGLGTEALVGEACPLGMVLRKRGGNVLGLGQVSNEDMDSLLDNAAVVLSTSLYEAGNGPGLDAWMRGVPVAMSNIPCFTEHLEALGVEADVFDPTSPAEIADVLARIVREPEEAARRGARSKLALSRGDEDLPARRYLEKLLAVAGAR